ncbi:MAG: carbonate dehydratase [Candidatus Omnitrophica bacterium]|nr:carbonate dehydratase [Candidatus Omnitrophota bacterium]
MIRSNPQGDFPKIDKAAYIDPLAVVIGKVKIGKNVYVAPGAVIRADEHNSSITIGNNCNVQDRAIIHALGNSNVWIGPDTSLSHGCIVHGPCRIGRGCFIGFGSVIFKATLYDSVFVKFSAVVSGVVIPAQRVIDDGVVIDGAEKTRNLALVSKESREFMKNVLKANTELVQGYKKSV